jgi:hypothetical protein
MNQIQTVKLLDELDDLADRIIIYTSVSGSDADTVVAAANLINELSHRLENVRVALQAWNAALVGIDMLEKELGVTK